VASHKSVPIHFSDLLNLREVSGDILSECKATPGHPSREHNINDHQHSLRRGGDKNISGLVSVAVIRKLKNLFPNS
jgi:hypothetical protein